MCNNKKCKYIASFMSPRKITGPVYNRIWRCSVALNVRCLAILIGFLANFLGQNCFISSNLSERIFAEEDEIFAEEAYLPLILNPDSWVVFDPSEISKCCNFWKRVRNVPYPLPKKSYAPRGPAYGIATRQPPSGRHSEHNNFTADANDPWVGITLPKSAGKFFSTFRFYAFNIIKKS